MTPPMQRVGRKNRRRFHPLAIAGIVVVLLTAFAWGYRQGANRKYYARLSALDTQERSLKTDHDACKIEKDTIMAKLAAGNSKAKLELAKLASLREDLRVVEEKTVVLTDKTAQCEAETRSYEERLAAQEEEDTLLRAEIETMRAKVDALRARLLTETSGEGSVGLERMRRLATTRQQYIAKCNAMPGCVVRSDEELLELHGARAYNKTQELLWCRDWNAHRASLLAQPLTPASPDFDDVYLVGTSGKDTQLQSLTFGREAGSVTYKNCTLPGATQLLHRSSQNLKWVLTDLVSLSLCAYHRQIRNATVPSLYFEHPETAALSGGTGRPRQGYIHQLLTSPYVTFADGCKREVSDLRQHSCHWNFVERDYGGHDFWTVRSRVLPTQAVADDAFQFYDAQELVSRPTLAVVVAPREESFCSLDLFYLYMRQAFPSDPAFDKFPGGDAIGNLTTTVASVARLIEEMDASAETPFAAIVLVMPPAFRDEVYNTFSSNTNLHNRLQYYEAPDDITALHGELVEMEIASRASAIVVNALGYWSNLVAERFLLLHDMKPNGRIFFA